MALIGSHSDLLEERAIATMLAALRYWERHASEEWRTYDFVASDEGRLVPLTDNEIDELCELLNLGALGNAE